MDPRLLEISEERKTLYARLVVLEDEEQQILTKAKRLEQTDFSMFKDVTSRLLTELAKARNRMLLYEDIRKNVMLDTEASDRAVRQVVVRARLEIRSHHDCLCEIKNVKSKGYRLVFRNR